LKFGCNQTAAAWQEFFLSRSCASFILVALISKYYYHRVKCCWFHGDLEEVSYGLSCSCVTPKAVGIIGHNWELRLVQGGSRSSWFLY
jgi:hypothetical protein